MSGTLVLSRGNLNNCLLLMFIKYIIKTKIIEILEVLGTGFLSYKNSFDIFCGQVSNVKNSFDPLIIIVFGFLSS